MAIPVFINELEQGKFKPLVAPDYNSYDDNIYGVGVLNADGSPLNGQLGGIGLVSHHTFSLFDEVGDVGTPGYANLWLFMINALTQDTSTPVNSLDGGFVKFEWETNGFNNSSGASVAGYFGNLQVVPFGSTTKVSGATVPGLYIANISGLAFSAGAGVRAPLVSLRASGASYFIQVWGVPITAPFPPPGL